MNRESGEEVSDNEEEALQALQSILANDRNMTHFPR
jgi:hypothetical protein